MKKLLLFIILTSSINVYSQDDIKELKKLSTEKEEIENAFLKKEKDLKDKIEELDSILINLKGTRQFTKRIEALEEKGQNYELIKSEEKLKEIDLNKIRYKAGTLVIKDIIELIKTLESQYKTLDFQQSYNDLANPNQYSSYKNNLTFLKEKLTKKQLLLPELNLNNPILNVAYSITQSIVSGQPKKDKDLKIKELTCILDYTSKASSDLNIVKYDLKYLQISLEKLKNHYEKVFKNYTNSVGYNENFETYIIDENDDLEDLTNNFFKNLNTESEDNRNKKLKTIKYQLTKIIDSYQEYEIFIRQALAYYEKFEIIMKSISPTCNMETIQKEIKTNHDKVSSKLNTAKISFENAYKGRIKQSYIKELIQN